MRKRLKAEILKNINRLSSLKDKPQAVASDIKRNWVDFKSFTNHHIKLTFLKGKSNVSQPTSDL